MERQTTSSLFLIINIERMKKQRKKRQKKATKKNCVKNCSPVRVFCFSWRPEKYKTFFSRRGKNIYILRVPNSTLSALLTVINIPYWRQKKKVAETHCVHLLFHRHKVAWSGVKEFYGGSCSMREYCVNSRKSTLCVSSGAVGRSAALVRVWGRGTPCRN